MCNSRFSPVRSYNIEFKVVQYTSSCNARPSVVYDMTFCNITRLSIMYYKTFTTFSCLLHDLHILHDYITFMYYTIFTILMYYYNQFPLIDMLFTSYWYAFFLIDFMELSNVGSPHMYTYMHGRGRKHFQNKKE